MKTCIICLSDDYNLIHPKKCECKVFLHETCLTLCEKHGLLCPICRIKIYSPYLQYDDGVNNIQVEDVNEHPINEHTIIQCPYNPKLFALMVGATVMGYIWVLYNMGQ